MFDLFREDELESTTQMDGDYDVITRCLSAPAHVIRDRLDIMGITPKLARIEFERGISKIAIAHDRQWPFGDYKFNDWRGIVAEIRDSNGTPSQSMSPIAQYFLDGDQDTCSGFPLVDPRLHLRAAIDEFDAKTIVQFYLDDLYDPDRAPLDYINSRINVDNVVCARDRKLIILTEGSTDVHILRGSLELLYPHLVEFVSFMDFHNTKLGGGAAELVKVVKAFAGAGVINRVVAVFDNDTAATEAIASLRDAKLPPTVRWVQLPWIELAHSYPTLSSTGNIEMVDVNGVAGSIEMYFGKDVLQNETGLLTPVHWRGFNEKLKRYQGKLADKRTLQQKFSSKIEECMRNPDRLAAADWVDMKAAIHHICFAFNRNTDAEADPVKKYSGARE